VTGSNLKPVLCRPDSVFGRYGLDISELCAAIKDGRISGKLGLYEAFLTGAIYVRDGRIRVAKGASAKRSTRRS
jgi:hypothetical protein